MPLSISGLTRRTTALLLAVVLAIAAGLVGARPARATFPGSNGKIGYTRWTNSGSDVATRSPGGSNFDTLVDDAEMGGWSPSGNRIVYIKRVSRTENNVWTMKADGSDRQRVTQQTGRYSAPEYTPHGDIIFTEFTDDGNGPARLFTINPNGTGRDEIAPNVDGDMMNGTFAPGGGRVAFQYVDGAKHGIYTVGPNGTNLEKVTGGIFDEYPDFSPGGGRIAFSRENSMGTKVNVFRVDRNGDDLKNLTNNASGVFSRRPSYSPNGERIAFDRSVSGSSDADIYTMRASDGGGRNAVATTSASEISPSWQPN